MQFFLWFAQLASNKNFRTSSTPTPDSFLWNFRFRRFPFAKLVAHAHQNILGPPAAWGKQLLDHQLFLASLFLDPWFRMGKSAAQLFRYSHFFSFV